MYYIIKAFALVGTAFLLPLPFQEIYAADSSFAKEVTSPSSFAPFLRSQTIYLHKYLTGVNTDQNAGFLM